MGLIEGPLALTFWPGGSPESTLPSEVLPEALVRAVVERARTELRLGNLSRCDTLLKAAQQRIDELNTGLEVISAVILTLRGETARNRGQDDRAADLFGEAVALFEREPVTTMSARDRGDFGMALAGQGRLAEALPHLALAAATEAGAPEHGRTLARAYLAADRVSEAEATIQTALLALPADPELCLLRAEVLRAGQDPTALPLLVEAARLLLAAGRPGQALPALEEADRARPGVAAGVRAEALMLLDRHQEAVEAFDLALRADPTDARLLVRRAAARAAMDDRDRASADLHAALAAAPDDVDVLLRAGETWLSQHEANGVDEAIRLARRARALDPDAWPAVVLEASALREAGDLEDALAVIRGVALQARTQPEVLRLHAELAQQLGLVSEAVDRFERLHANPRSHAGDWFEYADTLTVAGRPDEAQAMVEQGLLAWPDDLYLQALEVELMISRGETDTALAKARSVAERHPASAMAHLLVATALFRGSTAHRPTSSAAHKRRTAALEATERSSTLAPEWAEPWWLRAQVLFADGDLDGARVALDELEVREPHRRDAKRLAVDIHLAAGGDLAEAEATARDLLIETGSEAQDVFRLARVLARLGRSDEALDLVTAPDVPDTLDILLLRADLQSATGRFTDAAATLATAARLAPRRGEILIRQAVVARTIGDADAAIAYAHKALGRGAGNLDARIELAAALLLAGRPEEAEVHLTTVLGHRPGDIRARLLHAQLVGRRHPDQARAELTELAAEHPENTDILTVRAQLEIDSGDYQAALDVLDSVCTPNAYALQAEAHRLLGNTTEAIKGSRRALRDVPNHYGALATLGLLLLGTGDHPGAAKIFEQAQKAYPRDAATATRLGQTYAALDRYDKAFEVLDRAATAAPHSAWVMGTLIWTLADAGTFEPAIRLSRLLLDEHPDDADAWNVLGWCRYHLDKPDLDGAEQAFRNAVRIKDTRWYRKNLANVLSLGREPEKEAAELYQRSLDESLSRRSKHDLSLAGWCQYRLGNLDAAAQTLYEATSLQQRVGGAHFDLALVQVSDQRVDSGTKLYDRLVPVGENDPLRHRGLLTIAASDLRHARSQYKHLARSARITRVLATMEETVLTLPTVPDLRTVDLTRKLGIPRPLTKRT
ncbi:hypothetical protein GCM10010168_70640 [Actinoplanes ianthinogenes]|uniref:Tetratricopeptide repeat protein n=1 Tax=Actinoplanes ianthinogenes TaxID=122358 RepID=A0ABN6CQ34_9ACTN|nr:tetratricopeptide repeat protein [Actinoplanes ianthinogenes]BCJ47346.1 hypothetical protein Aiant_80030 [Actinoplanes ianthinogenes]GGR41880.1 hypothetical protein GCM10010168_70640 [Actinoplanes ianthinogenes]